MWDVHLNLKHAGCKQVLTKIRQKFWITQAKQFARNIVRKCVIPSKLHAGAYFYPKPPPLNKLRLQDKRAFYMIGIDNFGPLLVKDIITKITKCTRFGSHYIRMFLQKILSSI